MLDTDVYVNDKGIFFVKERLNLFTIRKFLL